MKLEKAVKKFFQDVAGGHYGNPPSTSLAAVEALTKEVQLKASHATD